MKTVSFYALFFPKETNRPCPFFVSCSGSSCCTRASPAAKWPRKSRRLDSPSFRPSFSFQRESVMFFFFLSDSSLPPPSATRHPPTLDGNIRNSRTMPKEISRLMISCIGSTSPPTNTNPNTNHQHHHKMPVSREELIVGGRFRISCAYILAFFFFYDRGERQLNNHLAVIPRPSRHRR